MKEKTIYPLKYDYPPLLTKKQEEMIKTLANKRVKTTDTLSLRQIASIFEVSHSKVDKVLKRQGFKRENYLKDRKCIICGRDKNFIDNHKLSVCKVCCEMLRKLK